ncbi:MAG: hypothetical protein KF690_08920, partial [Bacteroidetes bacterium]|nr:hypothetical protein [Bacteroidota bacterium]
RAFIPLSPRHTTTLILNEEWLAASRSSADHLIDWHGYRLTENRTWAFLRFRLDNHHLLDIGGMVQTRMPLSHTPEDVSFYSALGLTIQGPFGNI